MIPSEIEKINKLGHEMNKTIFFSWQKLANKTGWSVTTVRKYYDKDWYPGKYYQEPIKIRTNYNELNNQAGIYLLAQQIIENNEILNLIKIGQSKNLKKRLNSYKGMNPFVKCIDTLSCDIDDLDQIEQAGHLLLGTKNKRYGNTEWFICTEEQYNYWLKHKLDLFRRYNG